MEFPRRIVICDDDDVARRAIVSVARSYKLDIIETTTGRQAYSALIVGDVTLGFINAHAPDMDGLEVVRRVHAARLRHAPRLVAMSWMPSSDGLYREAGFDDQIHKPIDPERISAILYPLRTLRA